MISGLVFFPVIRDITQLRFFGSKISAISLAEYTDRSAVVNHRITGLSLARGWCRSANSSAFASVLRPESATSTKSRIRFANRDFGFQEYTRVLPCRLQTRTPVRSNRCNWRCTESNDTEKSRENPLKGVRIRIVN